MLKYFIPILFAEYFLEDIVQVLNYQPVPDSRKRKNKDEESVASAQEVEENCNLIVPDNYPPDVKAKVGMMSEKDVDFDVIEVSIFKCR